ncbi:MAG: hypothetical protein IKQ92_03450 [Clostridia bacterium]|nr:hypothetical protein [Clostridia bacterium]
MIYVAFIAGMFFGGFVGLGAMCLFVVSGDESRREELREAMKELRDDKTTVSSQD